MVTQLRGRHSTGLIGVYREKGEIRTQFYKDVGTSSDVLFSDGAKKILDKRPYVIAGHCRHATKGSITAKNAHPFKVKHILGMHNGTLYGDKEHGDKTDSQVFFEKLAEEGLQNALDNIVGAYVFVWIDHKRATLNMIRNEARTLYVMHGGGTTYWSSEFALLNLLRNRGLSACSVPESVSPHSHIEISLRSPRDVSVKELRPNRALFSAPRQDPPFKVEDHSKRRVIVHPPVESKKPPKLEHVILGPTDPVEKKAPTGFSTEALKRVRYRGYRMEEMSGDKARIILECGCAYCDRSAKILNTVYFYGKESFLCSSCVENPSRVEYVGAKIDDIWPSSCSLNKTNSQVQKEDTNVQSK